MAHVCENCKFRAHYDRKPHSALGRFWRWSFHVGEAHGAVVLVVLQVFAAIQDALQA